MKAKTFLAAFLGLGLMASIANAGFIINTTTTASSIPGYSYVAVFAKYDGEVGGATNLQSVDATFTLTNGNPATTANSFQFLKLDFDGDTVTDIDVDGATATTGNFPQTSYIHLGNTVNTVAGTWKNWLTGSPFEAAKPVSDTNLDGEFTPGADPNGTGKNDRLLAPLNDPAWNPTKSFRVAGFSTSPQVATSTLGARFAAVLVPTDEPVAAVLKLAGSSGATFTYNIPNIVPEPGMVGLLLISLGLLGRRGRKIA